LSEPGLKGLERFAGLIK